jgi:hypothetical protein
MRAMGIRVVAVDVGSVDPPSKFAWAVFDAPAREVLMAGDDPRTAVSALVAGLAWGGRTALVVESPLPDPAPSGQEDSWYWLGRARDDEGSRAWPADTGDPATGLARAEWMMRKLAEAVPGLTATTQPDLWRSGAARLLLAEAFARAAGRPMPLSASQEAVDVAAAGRALVELLDAPAPLAAAVRGLPHGSFNLLTAIALWAGLSIDPCELTQNVLVVDARPQPGH